MELELTRDQSNFRDEVRAFLNEKLTPALRAGTRATPTVYAEPDVGRIWQQILYEKGWLAYHWPVKHGGTGWSAVEQYIFEKECALADAPALPGMGTLMLGPALHKFGTAEQCARYLPKILSGEHYWCQGFSEPGAGSDLVSLKTRAVRDGDRYIINGRKIWVTHAHFADHMFCLARTDSDVKPQRGISFLLVDMKQPGVEVQPILGLAGDHEVNTVFLDDVIVHETDLVGREGQGWTITKFLLEHERRGSCYGPRLLASIKRLREQAAKEPAGSSNTLGCSNLFATKLALIELEALALETIEVRSLAELDNGLTPGSQTSLVKLAASNLRQRIDASTMSTFGYAGLQLCDQRPLHGESCPPPVRHKSAQLAAATYLNSRAWSIFGGTNEIQRTIIAKTVLGL